MASADELRQLELAVVEATRALARARADNQRADEAWERMVGQAKANVASGKSVSAEFIVAAGARARAAMNDHHDNPKVIPFRQGTLTPEALLEWTLANGVKPT